jgi:hypothetical protein
MSQTSVETEPGLKCLIEDISENGAMVRIGGLGRKNTTLKLQFPLGDRVIIMFGIVRAVEYNSAMKQSRLHVEGIDISEETKNAILSYVYNVMPKDDRDREEAIIQAEEDAKEDINALAAVAGNVPGAEIPPTLSVADENQKESDARAVQDDYVPPEINMGGDENNETQEDDFAFPDEENISYNDENADKEA